MKRKLKLLLIALMVFPFVAKADMAAPTFREFEVVVTAKNGISCDDGEVKKNFKKGDVIKVYGMLNYEEDGTSYYLVDTMCEVKAKDVKLRKETVAPTDKDITKVNKAIEGYIINKNGVDVRKGPSDMYEKVGHLDEGTKIKYNYYYDSEGWVTHVYVDQNGVKGWVSVIADSYDPNFKTVYTGDIKVIVTKEGTVDGITIPANTILKIKYNLTPNYVDSITPIVEYNGKELELYDIDFEFISDKTSESSKSAKFEITLSADTDVYTNIENKGDKLITIPKGTKVKSINLIYEETMSACESSAYFYVEYKGKKGWILVDENNYEEFNCGSELNNNIVTTTKKIVKVKTEEQKEEVTEDKKSGFSNKIYIWCAIGAGICAACVAIILLIKNNKKNK